MDPLRALSLDPLFYRLTEDLSIDLDHFRERIDEGGIRAVLTVHYFGRVDPAAEEAIAMARERKLPVLEDEAHSWLSDIVAGRGGRCGEASIASLHKLLPSRSGGLLMLNTPTIPGETAQPLTDIMDPFAYDLHRIANRRRENAAHLHRLVRQELGGVIEPLWPCWPGEDVPQTFPVRVLGLDRNLLYEDLNAAGYGAVTLYHTLVGEITPEEFPISHEISQKILNLPIHQDAGESDLAGMVDWLAAHVGGLRS